MSSKFTPKPWVPYAVTDVKLEPEFLPELSDVEEKVYNAFLELKNETGKFPLTAHVAKHLGSSNKSWVGDKLNRLVGYGYIGSYQKNNKRHWTDRENAERMLKLISNQ